MLELILVRHAQAASIATHIQDIERPLNTAGNVQADFLGKQLKKRKVVPQLILTSPAIRTLSTAELLATILNYPTQNIQKITELYLAEAADILQVIGEIPFSIHQAMLVGHNPGLSQVCRILADPILAELPTAGAFFLQWEADSWENIIEQNIQPDNFILLDLSAD